MERKDALFRRYEVFVSAAAIAAHASAAEDGFRQRDVRFLIELFTNWVEGSLHGGMIELKNTQVQRFLEDLVRNGSAKRQLKRKQPCYRLTRLGLLELLSRLSNRPSGGRPEHFFFLFYFLKNYGPRIVDLIRAEGKHFPSAMRLEIEALLDYGRLLRDEISRVERELKKLEERMDDAVNAGKLATKLFAAETPIDVVVKQLESRYPYELNSQKPLSELIGGIPRDIGRWELQVGNLKRVEEMWMPTRALFRCYLDSLKQHLRSISSG